MRKMCDDQVLIERFNRGDKHAIDELLHQYRDLAYSYALKLTKNYEEAADVVAECFVRIHRSLHRYQANSSFSTWMYRILKNCFLDMRKKKMSRPYVSLDATMESDDGVLVMQPIDDSDSPFDVTARNCMVDEVKNILNRLTPYEKHLLMLYHDHEYTYDEIAKLLNSPAGTVKSRFYRARQKFEKIIRSDSQLMEALGLGHLPDSPGLPPLAGSPG
jgi:RNA polymerase sigma-70 factor (ECF subfamily)